MPELPDVEAMRRYLLAQGLLGRTVVKVMVGWPKAIRAPSPSGFVSGLAGRAIREIGRRAKYLLFRLDRGVMVVHLRMTGSLEVASPGTAPERFAHNVFLLDDGRELRFRDPRKLGMMWLVEDEEPLLRHLGPEPLGLAFTQEVLESRLKGKSVALKPLLCQQEVLAGIGNIYADEVLFCAGIHPQRMPDTLAPREWRALHRCTVDVLARATEGLARLMPIQGPPTESEVGEGVLRVPRVEEAPCHGCGGPIRRLVMRNRCQLSLPSFTYAFRRHQAWLCHTRGLGRRSQITAV